MTSDELSGLNNPCSSAFLAPICFLEPFLSLFSGQNGHVDLRARTSPQVKIGRNSGNDVLLFAIRSTDDKDDGRSPLSSFSAWMTLLAERNGGAMTNAPEIFRK